VETLIAAWNVLVGAAAGRIVEVALSLLPPLAHPTILGDGHASERITQVMTRNSSPARAAQRGCLT